MRQIFKSFIIGLSLMTLSSCSTGFQQNALYEQKIKHYQQNKDPQNDSCYINHIAAANDVKQLQYLITQARHNHTLDKKLRCTGNATGTPLGMAVAENAYQAVELLLKYGADPSDRGEESEAPVMIAVLQKQNKMIRLLLDYGAAKKLNYDFESARIKEAGAAITQLFLEKGNKKRKHALLR